MAKVLLRVVKGRTDRIKKLREAKRIHDQQVETPIRPYVQRRFEIRPDYSYPYGLECYLVTELKLLLIGRVGKLRDPK